MENKEIFNFIEKQIKSKNYAFKIVDDEEELVFYVDGFKNLSKGRLNNTEYCDLCATKKLWYEFEEFYRYDEEEDVLGFVEDAENFSYKFTTYKLNNDKIEKIAVEEIILK